MVRRPEAGDEAGYVRVFTRPEVNLWLRPWPMPPIVPSEASAMLLEDLRHWREHGYGPFAVVEEAVGYAGRVGLRQTQIEAEEAVELAWTVDPDLHGRGLATAGAEAGIELACEVGLEELVAVALPDNAASRRVAEKVGMELVGDVEHAGLPHVLYRLRI